MAIRDIAGCIGWCAFDYNTHKDFGSGDRICHHGVMDMFREPKFAAFAYASQCEPDEAVVLEPVTFWARGERNIGGVLPLIVLTNCDEVELALRRQSRRSGSGRTASASPTCRMPPVIFERRHFTDDELGRWGMLWEDAHDHRLDRRQAGGTRSASPPIRCRRRWRWSPTARRSRPRPTDCVRVMVRALDQAGHKLPFLFEPVEIAVAGAGRLVGPEPGAAARRRDRLLGRVDRRAGDDHRHACRARASAPAHASRCHGRMRKRR